jgi:hypothetical protein
MVSRSRAGYERVDTIVPNIPGDTRGLPGFCKGVLAMAPLPQTAEELVVCEDRSKRRRRGPVKDRC